jgi:hypothetical protein
MPEDPSTTLLLDRQEISDALVSYCWALDFGDWELMRGVFTPDAVLTTASDSVDSADAIVELMRSSRSRFKLTQHLLTNVRITITGDTAAVTSYVAGFDTRDTTPEKLVRIIGYYIDDFTKVDGRWLIRKRVIRRTWLDPYDQ